MAETMGWSFLWLVDVQKSFRSDYAFVLRRHALCVIQSDTSKVDCSSTSC